MKELTIELTPEETQKLYDDNYCIAKRDRDMILVTYCQDDDTYIYSIIPQRTKIEVKLAY